MKPDPRAETQFHISLPVLEEKDTVSPVYNALLELCTKVNGRLSLGSGEHNALTGNIEGICIDVLTPSIADTNFTINHNLGYVPQRCAIMLADRAATIYLAPDAGRTETQITLRCNVASATLKIWIY